MSKKLLSCLLIVCLTTTCITGFCHAEPSIRVGDGTVDGYFYGFDNESEITINKTVQVQVGERKLVSTRYLVSDGDTDLTPGMYDVVLTRAYSSEEKYAVAKFDKPNNTTLLFYVDGIAPGESTVTFEYYFKSRDTRTGTCTVNVKVKVVEPFQPLEFKIVAPEHMEIYLKTLDSPKDIENEYKWNAFSTFMSLIPLAKYVVHVADITLTVYATDYIRWDPYPATIRVQVHNPNAYSVYGVGYTITTNTSGAETGITFADIPMVSELFEMPPNSTKTFTYEVRPEIVYNSSYTTTFKMETFCKNPTTKNYYKTIENDSTMVVSKLSDKETYENYPLARNRHMNKDENVNTGLNNSKIINVQCPVNVNILDTGGNVLATIESYDEEVFTADGIAAYAIDDAKAVVIDHEYLDSYRISIDAVGDGSMTITSVDILEDGTYAMSHHAEVPLTSGDTFSADISDTSVTRVYSGAGEEITADLVLNRETVASMLVEAGYSEAWQASALEAILRGLVTPGLAENPQNATTYEEYAAALLAMMENFIGVGAGYYAEYYSEALGRTDLTAMDILTELGVTGMTDFSGDINAPITRGDMAIMTTSMLENLCIEYAFDEVEWTDVTDGNIAWSAGFMYHIGAMYCESEGVFAPAGTITHEESIHALYMLWTYIQNPQLPPEIDPATEYADTEIIKGVQTALNELGYDCGTPDGVAGKNTAAAITAFQTDMEITVTGTVTEETLIWLGWMGYDIPR